MRPLKFIRRHQLPATSITEEKKGELEQESTLIPLGWGGIDGSTSAEATFVQAPFDRVQLDET